MKLSKTARDLYDEISQFTIIDAHEHLPSEEAYLSNGYSGPNMFAGGYVWHDLESAGMPAKFKETLRQGGDRPVEEWWPQIRPYWQHVKYTSYARALRITVRDLYSIDEIDDSTIHVLAERVKADNTPGLYHLVTSRRRGEHAGKQLQRLRLIVDQEHALHVLSQVIQGREKRLAGDPVPPPPQPTRGKPRKNQAHFDLATALYRTVGVDLTAIDGIDALTAQTLISEIGLDMSKWPTVKHFTSWLGLAPHNKKSGGKLLRSRTLKTKNRANTALRVAAQSLSRSKSALGGFYRRMRAKHGAAKANVATAHKLARIVYQMLKYRQPYTDPGEWHYEQQYRDRVIRNLRRKAASLGLELVPAAPEPSQVS